MKIVVAPTTFKGSIGVMDACIAIIKGIREVHPKADIIQVPISDGGDGFLESLLFNVGGEFLHTTATNPVGKRIETVCGRLRNGKGVVEMAKASGVAFLRAEEKDPLITTSYGTGELIDFLIRSGIKDIVVGVGGSATIDMGVGCMQALGVDFLDINGKNVGFGGKELVRIKTIDIDRASKRLKNLKLVIAADVKNPLLGEEGAVVTYGRQKGLSSKEIPFMEDGLRNVAEIIKESFDKDVTKIPGGGAAGGIAAGLYGILNAEIKEGTEVLLEMVNLEEKTADAELIITGEGRFDRQSMYGKAAYRVLQLGHKNNIFVVLLTGELTDEAMEVFKPGKSLGINITPPGMSQKEAMKRVSQLLQNSTERALRKFSGLRIR
ncbi:MAG: hypothetical protein B5M53_06015 [Candidatus Cloacimonas sp. 4484_209]|nr:MAG: hypothetical protein B5M53_06015 [Candidatus Cloacimonas sp. 4484_209]